jgi:hypothetical protein
MVAATAADNTLALKNLFMTVSCSKPHRRYRSDVA